METTFFSGILLILLAGCCSGVFSTPFNKNKKWAWENNWLIWSLVALIVCPSIAAFCTIPHLFSVYATHPSTTAIIAVFGFIWGISSLMFGRGIDYLGVSLAIPIMQGLINAVGTISPFFGSPGELLLPEYRHILLGLAVTIVGIVFFALAGKSKSQGNTSVKSGSQGNPSGKSFTKGLLICLFAGIFGPLINIGFVYGEPLQETAVELGAGKLFAANAIWAVIFFTGCIANAGHCIILLKKNGTSEAYRQSKGINFFWAIFSGILWYGSFLFYGMGCNRIGGYAASIGWAIMQSTAVIAGNVAGILMGEWKGAPRSSVLKMAGGMALLIIGEIIFALM